jgi:hypothetical protein
MAPTQGEILQERFGNDPQALAMRMQVQARETLEGLEHRGALFSLVLELRQGRDGKLRELRLLEGSGNATFDSWVLKASAVALEHASVPPPDAFRSEILRSVWRVEARLHTDNALAGLVPDLQGIPVGLLANYLNPEKAKVDVRAKLLRVY